MFARIFTIVVITVFATGCSVQTKDYFPSLSDTFTQNCGKDAKEFRRLNANVIQNGDTYFMVATYRCENHKEFTYIEMTR
jgi:hypothetical protein